MNPANLQIQNPMFLADTEKYTQCLEFHFGQVTKAQECSM